MKFTGNRVVLRSKLFIINSSKCKTKAQSCDMSYRVEISIGRCRQRGGKRVFRKKRRIVTLGSRGRRNNIHIQARNREVMGSVGGTRGTRGMGGT